MKKSKISLLALALVALSSQAFATSITSSLQSTATISSSCLVSATDISFGSYSPRTGSSTSGTITSTCSNAVPYTISMSSGGSGNVSAKAMTGTKGDTLLYSITNQANQELGDGTGGTVVISLTGTGVAQTTTMQAQIVVLPGGVAQFVTPDNYSDTLTLTVAY